MTVTRHSSARRLALAAALACLTACSVVEPPIGAPIVTAIQVAPVDIRHSVYFATDDDRLDPVEAAALDAFVAQLDERMTVDLIAAGHADVRAGDAHNDALSARRAGRVAEALQQRGIAAAQITRHGLGRRFPIAADETTESWRLSRRVELVARGLVVVEPSCPNWSQDFSRDATNRALPNLGCATQLNLVRMVADPRDLYRASPLGKPDPTREFGAVQRYREDKVKDLKLESAAR